MRRALCLGGGQARCRRLGIAGRRHGAGRTTGCGIGPSSGGQVLPRAAQYGGRRRPRHVSRARAIEAAVAELPFCTAAPCGGRSRADGGAARGGGVDGDRLRGGRLGRGRLRPKRGAEPGDRGVRRCWQRRSVHAACPAGARRVQRQVSSPRAIAHKLRRLPHQRRGVPPSSADSRGHSGGGRDLGGRAGNPQGQQRARHPRAPVVARRQRCAACGQQRLDRQRATVPSEQVAVQPALLPSQPGDRAAPRAGVGGVQVHGRCGRAGHQRGGCGCLPRSGSAARRRGARHGGSGRPLGGGHAAQRCMPHLPDGGSRSVSAGQAGSARAAKRRPLAGCSGPPQLGAFRGSARLRAAEGAVLEQVLLGLAGGRRAAH
mmetsp:Transcript_17402/g.52517  ORF Transcript_17402/g.52517 Transcript_17402/m.52517 type:complete len:374 (-) Transcript_17402:605-1726(-)